MAIQLLESDFPTDRLPLLRWLMFTGVCAFGCPQDAKQAMHVSYVPKALAAGAELYTRCRVDRIVVADGAAFGVLASCLDSRDRPSGRYLRVLADRIDRGEWQSGDL